MRLQERRNPGRVIVRCSGFPAVVPRDSGAMWVLCRSGAETEPLDQGVPSTAPAPRLSSGQPEHPGINAQVRLLRESGRAQKHTERPPEAGENEGVDRHILAQNLRLMVKCDGATVGPQHPARPRQLCYEPSAAGDEICGRSGALRGEGLGSGPATFATGPPLQPSQASARVQVRTASAKREIPTPSADTDSRYHGSCLSPHRAPKHDGTFHGAVVKGVLRACKRRLN